VGAAFSVVPADVVELTGGEPRAVALENARRKAVAVGGDLVLGADTLVTIDGEILGKPRDAAQAVDYVGRLAGRSHHVVGGIAIARDGEVVADAVEVTEVVFRSLSADEVEDYVALGEWEGRAGGYAIQGAGAALVRSITGEYLNVVGLPLARLLDLLPRS
jgi:septum formation protein